MPGLVPGIHVFLRHTKEDVDGRVKPGHDEHLFIALAPRAIRNIRKYREIFTPR
jgi:hypothetical protein